MRVAFRTKFFGWFLGLSLLLRLSSSASVVFDWPSTPGWTAGTPGPGHTDTQSFTSVTQNDITVSINNNGSSAQGAQWAAGYPKIDSTSETGGFSGVNGLQFYVSKQSSTSSVIKTTVTFSNPVINLSFQIWDVDASSGQFVDKISAIQALAQNGTVVAASSVTSAVPGYNTISGSGLTTVVLGTKLASDTTNQGTINITFSGPITQFSFNWSNNDSGLGGQAIALGPLTYTPVPEFDPLWSTMAACTTVIGFEFVRRRKRRK